MERYEAFAKVLKSKHPEIKLVSSVGPFAGGELFNYLNPLLRDMSADLLDEHYYMSPDFFQKNAKRYDNYDRSSSKIFAGEYAAHVRDTEGQGRSIWLAALSEAAFMTGLERNGEVVNMCSYAPLFAHVDAWQWAPNLIWFDNLKSYGTASYQVQKLFSLNKGTEVLSATMKGAPIAGEDSLYVSAVRDQNTKEVIVKVVNTSSIVKQSKLNFSGKSKGTYSSIVNWIESDLKATNTLDNSQLISPKTKELMIKPASTLINFPAHSVTVIKVKL
jgi:alpha-L-arabinofuranosidase